MLELAFPGFDKAFQNPLRPSSLQILTHFPSSSSLLQANKEVVLQHLMLYRRGRLWNEKKYEKLIYIAKHSLPDPCVANAHHFVMLPYIQIIQSYITSLSALALQMKNRTEHAYPYQLLCSIPGVGPITAATIYAEIGDIKRFPSEKQLRAFAGLDSSVYESGTFKANKNHITKRGSTYLRMALYQATVSGISKQIHGPRNLILFQFYQQELDEGKPTKVAIVATSNKLLRMIFGILRHEQPFRIDKK